MVLCRDGIWISIATAAPFRGLVALLVLFIQLGPVFAEVPSVAQGGGSGAVPADPLEFTSPEAGVQRAGYVTIQWSEHPDAFTYQLINSDGTELYRGAFAQAFVSGLPDGEYSFVATAVDQSGQVIARTAEPYHVTVEHWSLTQAWTLFSIGMIVFVCLVWVIIRGAVSTGKAALAANPSPSDGSPEISR